MSKKNEVIWPAVEDNLPNPDIQYVDTLGILEPCLDALAPKAWVDGDEDAPASQNLLLNGPPGVGKSLLAAHLAVEVGKRLGKKVPIQVIDCSSGTKEWHLTGMITRLPDGSTPFVAGPFPSAIQLANEAGACVLNVEEISSLNPQSQKMFNRMTDWRRSLSLAETGERYNLKPGCRVLVVASMNPSVFGGVFSLNQDLRSRFFELRVPHPEMDDEKAILRAVCPWAKKHDVDNMAQIAADSRTRATEYQLSTRDLVSTLTVYHTTGNLEFALRGLANKFEGGQERKLILSKIKSVFKVQIES